MKVKGGEKLVEGVLKAVEEGEKIYLFGDGDLDGVAAVLIFEEALEKLGASPFSFFSDRQEHGYGLSPHYLKKLKKKKPGLLLTFDLGTNNREGIKKAKKMGFEVVVVDHHAATEEMPEILAFVNPKEKDGMVELCTAGLSLKLAEGLLKKAGEDFMEEDFLELAMLATISDQMGEEGENIEILEKGIEAIKSTERPALRALLTETYIATEKIDRGNLERYVLPLLSACGTKRGKSEAYLFLKEKSLKKAKSVIPLLIRKRGLQKERTEEIVMEAGKGVSADTPFIFKGDRSWPLVLCARAASKLVDEFEVPVFLFHKEKKESQGSVRAPSEFNILEPLEKCRHLLLNGGGHPQAAGFGLKNKDLPRFEKCLKKSIK